MSVHQRTAATHSRTVHTVRSAPGAPDRRPVLALAAAPSHQALPTVWQQRGYSSALLGAVWSVVAGRPRERRGWRGPGGMAVDSETACAAMDASDELSFVRERFVLPVGKIYLDGAWPAQPVGTASRPHVARATLVA